MKSARFQCHFFPRASHQQQSFRVSPSTQKGLLSDANSFVSNQSHERQKRNGDSTKDLVLSSTQATEEKRKPKNFYAIQRRLCTRSHHLRRFAPTHHFATVFFHKQQQELINTNVHQQVRSISPTIVTSLSDLRPWYIISTVVVSREGAMIDFNSSSALAVDQRKLFLLDLLLIVSSLLWFRVWAFRGNPVSRLPVL